MTAWLALFAAEATVVARRRLDVHRKFDQGGAWLAVAVVAVGIVTILVRTRLMYPAATPWRSAVVFVAFDGLRLLLFGILVSLAWRYRPRPAIHRRLMTMAIVALLPPAFGRLVAYLQHDHIPIVVVGLMTATTLIFVTVDALRSHHVPPATWVPGLLVLLISGATYFAQVYT
jgi:small basic protein